MYTAKTKYDLNIYKPSMKSIDLTKHNTLQINNRISSR